MMSPQAHEFKGRAQVTGDIGETLQKRLEALRSREQQHHGGVSMARDLEKVISSLGEKAANAYKDGYLDALEPEEVLQLIRAYLDDATTLCRDLADRAEKMGHVAAGQGAATQFAVDLVQRHHSVSCGRYESLTAPPEADDGEGPTSFNEGKVPFHERGTAAEPEED
ncbi:MAG: hypothetical protein B7733_06095 [Myxococcales bacterium FL481]|nr:MAG: hypothetical protein B7733_06095 [Myxococcales bacterium FL481]